LLKDEVASWRRVWRWWRWSLACWRHFGSVLKFQQEQIVREG